MTLDLKVLLEPWDVPYTEDDARVRAIQLYRVYDACERNKVCAGAVAGLADQSYWAFLALLTWTKDEKAVAMMTKPFSPLRCYATLADWADQKTDKGVWAHPLIAIDKSRQLMMSWWSIVRLYWICQRRPFSHCPILSKNENDAQELMGRLDVMHGLLPGWYKKLKNLEGVRMLAESMVFPNRSKIEAMPQKGGDAMRSRVPTMWLSDEAAFQSDFKNNFKAAKGTSDARTQGIMVTTANPSFFQLLIEDRLDGHSGGKEKVYHKSTGLEIWRNRINMVDCARIHYTADPSRRTAEWKRQAMQGMSKDQWRQEQEIDYLARGGQPIFKMLERDVHLMAGRAEVLSLGEGRFGLRVQGYCRPDGEPILRRVRLIRAIDHGTTNYCACVWVAVDEEHDWTVYRTYRKRGWGARENAKAIAELSGSERYAANVADAFLGLPDRSGGKVIDLYRDYQAPDGTYPLRSIEEVKKGSGSRQEGLDAISLMLHATLAIEQPEAPYWALEDYTADHIESFARESALYLAPGCEDLFDEMAAARYDERPGGDPNMAQPETSVDMADDLLDCLRYAIRSGSQWIRKKNPISLPV